MKTQIKPISFFAPITRVDSEKRIVEGIAFANEVVEGEGGIRLKRTAMEDATPDYMKWGTLRAMHQPSAAGTAAPLDPELARECGAFWMEGQDYDPDNASIAGKRVCVLRSYVSDEADFKKCLDGTYKGYSVGVAPKVMRGKNVEVCTWIETSLVDRPKDPDALLTIRGDFEIGSEVEVEVQRASFEEYLEGWAPADLRDMALNYLWNSLWDIQYATELSADEKAAAIRQTCQEFADFMVGALATGQLPNISGDEVLENMASLPPFQRIAELTGEVAQTLERLSAAENQVFTLTSERDETQAELARVQGLHEEAVQRATTAEGRVADLEKMPKRVPPVRNFSAQERAVGVVSKPEAHLIRAAEIDAEIQKVLALPKTMDSDEQQRRIHRVTELKREKAEIEGS